ncbi:MAG: segregation/condensation protein A [Nitrospirota bacterium]
MENIYNIKLSAFEGPLDLLLHLVKENEIDIYDIPIALITHQYLEYIELMKELNLEIAGEFLVMAATLIHIKSRMLLPPDEEAFLEEQEDPRLELVHRLIEYQVFKDAALNLREREEEWMKVFHREPVSDDVDTELYLFDINLFDLLGAFKKIIDTASPEVISITKETLTVKDKMSFIIGVLEGQDAIRFEEFFKVGIDSQREGINRVQLIVTFIALLELIRLGLVRAYQEREFGNIWVINPSKQSPVI